MPAHRVPLLEPSLEDGAGKGSGETCTLHVRVAPVKTVALDRSWPATCLAAPHTTPAWSGCYRRPAPISPAAHGRQTCPPPPCAQSEPARGRGHLWPLPTPQQERLGPPEQAPWKGPAAAPGEAGAAAAGRPDPAQVLGLPGEHVSASAQAALSRARHTPRWGHTAGRPGYGRQGGGWVSCRARCAAATDPFRAAPRRGARAPVDGARLATPPPFPECRTWGTAKLTPARALVIYSSAKRMMTPLSPSPECSTQKATF